MRPAGFLVVTALALTAGVDSASVVVLPGEKPVAVRLDIAIDGKGVEVVWEAFLDRLFDHFDRDGDGSLSRSEAQRIMPLPLPGGKELAIDFDRLDADSDGKGSRAELRAFCRRHGFTPVVTVVVPPSADDARLAALFLRRLDADGDGKLTAAQLRRAPRALARYDLNDDEALDRTELLAGAVGDTRAGVARVRLGGAAEADEVVLRLDLGEKPRATLGGKGRGLVRLGQGSEGGYRLHGPGGWWLTFRPTRATADLRSVGEFLIAQFKGALGGGRSLSKAELEEDATLAGLLDLLVYADRDGDGRLSLAELQGYLRLVEMGMRAQVWVSVADRGRNPFTFLDRDGDGRLSHRELRSAVDLLGGKAAAAGLPEQFELSFGGPAVKSWGGVAVPAAKAAVVKQPVVAEAPAWFRAMDRNGDGVVSRREFLGPTEVFAQVDTDGDGVISAAEAMQASAGRKP